MKIKNIRKRRLNWRAKNSLFNLWSKWMIYIASDVKNAKTKSRKTNGIRIILNYCSDFNSTNVFIQEQDVKGLLDSLGLTTF